MRSLDFTVCTTKCTIPCWRKLTKEEEEWLKKTIRIELVMPTSIVLIKQLRSMRNDIR